jgi:hypothetical protein
MVRAGPRVPRLPAVALLTAGGVQSGLPGLFGPERVCGQSNAESETNDRLSGVSQWGCVTIGMLRPAGDQATLLPHNPGRSHLV